MRERCARAADGLQALVAGLRGPAALGRAYLRAAPGEASAQRLLAAILAGDGAAVRAREAPDAVLRERVRRRIRQDFAQDRLVQVEGWLLARTEARICALVALSGGDAAA